MLALKAGMATPSKVRGTSARNSLVRSAVLLASLLGVPGAAMAGSKSASMRIGAQVVASVRLQANATADGKLAVEVRAFGGEAGPVLVHQRSGQPVRLRSGARLPSETDVPLLVTGNGELDLRRSAAPAEVVVTMFSDGLPPRS